MGFGASTLILGNLAGSMINSVSIGWRQTYIILGVSMGLVLLLESLLIRFPPPGMEFPKPVQIQSRQGSAALEFASRDYTTMEMLKRGTFWRFFIFAVMLVSVGSTVISFAKDLTMSVGAADALATSLVGVLAICNGLGRILCGAVFDIAGLKKTLLLANALTISAVIVSLLSIVTGSLPACIAGLCLTGLSYGCGPTITSVFVSTFYGVKHFAMNFSIVNTVLIPASFVAVLAAGLASYTGTYAASFLMLLFLALFGSVLSLSIKRP